MKIDAILQARMGSIGLPGKVLKKIGDKPLLEIIVNKLKQSIYIDDIIVATTRNEEDNSICALAKELDVQCFRGSENNVLERFYWAAREFKSDVIIRATGDNPFTEANLVDKLIASHLEHKAQYTEPSAIPFGAYAEVIDRKALSIAYQRAHDSLSREHVTLYFKNNPNEFRLNKVNFGYVDNPRLTIDTKEDLRLIRELHNRTKGIDRISLDEAIKFLNKNRDLQRINSGIRQKLVQNKNPELSVIIRTFNSEDCIKDAFYSALDQSLPNHLYEIILIDDGSSDNTQAILRKYQKKYPDMVTCIFREHQGPIKTLNAAIKKAQGKFFIILDSDDKFSEDIIEKMYRKHYASDTGFVYCDYFEVDKDLRRKKRISLARNVLNSVAAGIMFKKEAVEKVGYYNEDLIFPEYDLLIKLLKRDKGEYIVEPLFTYFRKENSITSDPKKVEEGKKQLKQRYASNFKFRSY